MHPSVNKPRMQLFRTPETKRIRKLFSLLTPFGKISAVLNERKQKKALKVGCTLRHLRRASDFQSFLTFLAIDPPVPNFAKIHAKGRRGRLELNHRDLIPPPLGA